jgi:nucleotidyltransferase/DNA polymerase involved in DNA repair
VRSWGIAWERAYGEVTVHIEKFGMENEKSTIATGLRFNIMEDLQLDASVGRSDKQNIVTLGLKWMF